MRSENTKTDFYDLFLRFNRKLVGILRSLRPSLSVTSSHVLAFLRSRPESSAKDLVEAMSLEKSTVSRCLSELLARQYIVESTSQTDRRRKSLVLTIDGVNALTADQMLRNKEASVAIEELDQEQQDFLSSALSRMADNYQQPSIDSHPADHPVERQIRRLTRAMGFVGPSCLGTGLPVEQCQVLHLLEASPQVTALKQLQILLPYDLTVVSRLVSGLAQRGLIKKSTASKDSRAVEIRLSAKGTNAAKKAHAAGTSFIQTGLNGFSNQEQARLRSILERFLPQHALAQTPRVAEITVEEIRTEQQRQTARGLYVAEAVRRYSHFSLPESIFSSSSRSFLASVGPQPAALLEIPRGPKQAARILFLPSEVAAPSVFTTLLSAIFKRFDVHPFTLASESVPEALRESLGASGSRLVTVDPDLLHALPALREP